MSFQLLHGFYGKTSPPLATFAEYLGGLLLVATPLLGALAFWCSGKTLVRKNEAGRFLAVFFATIVLFFAVSALKRKVEANWPMLAFFSGVILVAADWHQFHRLLRRATVGLLILAIVTAMAYLSLPANFGLSIAGQPLDIERMDEFYGGKQVAAAVRKKTKNFRLTLSAPPGTPFWGKSPFTPLNCARCSGSQMAADVDSPGLTTANGKINSPFWYQYTRGAGSGLKGCNRWVAS